MRLSMVSVKDLAAVPQDRHQILTHLPAVYLSTSLFQPIDFLATIQSRVGRLPVPVNLLQRSKVTKRVNQELQERPTTGSSRSRTASAA